MAYESLQPTAADYLRLGDIIRRRRLELGLTQEQLAERITADGEFVRQSDISNLERGAVQLPRRERLERIALALGLSLGQLLTRSGWAEADRYLAAAMLGVPPFTTEVAPPSRQLRVHDGHWWESDARAVRVIGVRLANGHLERVIDGYRNAVTWMATAEEGFRGFLLLVDRYTNELVSFGFWESEVAMRASYSSIFLPRQMMRFQQMFAVPPSIEFYQVTSRATPDTQMTEGQHSQVDRATRSLVKPQEAIEEFRRQVERAREHRPHLDRAVLLFDPGSGLSVAAGIWEEEGAERQDDSPRFPQLVRPSQSHHFEVVIEI